MRRLVFIALAAAALMLANTGAAEARLFEPQANWLHSGRVCASTRGPPAFRGEALPPRACRDTERTPPRSVRTARLAMPLDGGICTRKPSMPDVRLV
jgi:hypothetical protein